MVDQRQYWLGLSLVKWIGPGRTRSLLERFDDPHAIWNASPAELAAARLPDSAAKSLLAAREELDLAAELARVLESGCQLLTWDDSDYPRRLREIHSPPLVLYVKGEVLEADSRAVAIVGTRNATDYGRAMAGEVASHLAGQGVTIVSGLARGIDGIAHRERWMPGAERLRSSARVSTFCTRPNTLAWPIVSCRAVRWSVIIRSARSPNRETFRPVTGLSRGSRWRW